MTERRYVLGEIKWAEFKVKPLREHDTLVVTSATYILYRQNNEVEQSGTCEINGDVVKALLEPSNKGRYRLEVSVTIPPETRIARVDIYVT